ncbi:TonB-dependent receptor [Alteromonas sp. ALT199]|uniref:TonB-dependent receptor n=1 Tax=unclassified Alteromonas TaxID=2614992 RepID=UPI00044D9136|nr:TonB-dependent receptor [Alteromonas sp. ALT199]MBT3135206.1 TonB-dependent receptor [Alteromonas sp. ALT199]
MGHRQTSQHNTKHFQKKRLSILVSSLFACTGVSMLAMGNLAYAQEEVPEKPEKEIERIFVTAVPGGSVDPLESSVSISSIDSDSPVFEVSRTTAEILRQIPGVRSEASGGDGNANIAIRGLPIASGGAKFLQLWEDGLPVLEFGDISFANADIFLRADANVARVEAIRGGSASILASNSPGGVINFISKTGEQGGGTVRLTKGLTYDTTRLDFEAGHNWENGWYGHIGGFYRVGEGPREAGYDVNKGGQIKANLTKEFDGGYIRGNMKILNDRAVGYMPTPMFVSGTNANPSYSSIPGYSANGDTLQSVHTDIIQVLDEQNNVVQKRLSDGMQSDVKQFGFEASLDDIGGGWALLNRFKMADISGEFVVPFPASVGTQDNRGAFVGNYLAGSEGRTDFSYIYATGPNTGQALAPDTSVAVIHTFNTEMQDLSNLMNNLDLSKVFSLSDDSELEVHAGWYHSEQAIENFQSWPSYLTSVEGGGDTAYVDVVDDVSGETLTSGGLISYGPAEWGNCCNGGFNLDTKIDAFYVNTTYYSGDFTFDAGLRYDSGRTTGSRSLDANSIRVTDFDVNNNGSIEGVEGQVSLHNPEPEFAVDFDYDYFSYSLGANYLVDTDLSVFGRYSVGYRANSERLIGLVYTPANVVDPDSSAFGKKVGDIDDERIEDQVKMLEIGVKYRFDSLDINAVYFSAETQEVVGESRVTGGPLSLRDYESSGIEVEAFYSINNFNFSGNVTWTDAEIAADDLFPDFVGNVPQRQADWVYSAIASYDTESYTVGLNIVGTTDSYVRNENVLVMPGYLTTNLFATYRFNDDLSVSLNVNNLTDEIGLTEGENAAVGASEPFTNEYVRMRSISGRSAVASINYTF